MHCCISALGVDCLCLGSLLALRGWHPSVIRWDLMHVVHLGLLYVINGAALHLISSLYAWNCSCLSPLVPLFVCLSVWRLTLLNLGFFAPIGETLVHKLAAAYKDFKLWCRMHKISCSQPPFTKGMVPSQKLNRKICCLFSVLPV